MSNVQSGTVHDNAPARQRSYYETTADGYDTAHVEREHIVALHLLAAYIELAGVKNVLDVGAGTGRAMRFLKGRFPGLLIKGNFMGQGPAWLRQIKRGLWSAGLWPLAEMIKIRGKGYTYSEGDGVAYSYSVFQSLAQICAAWSDVNVVATSPNRGRHASPLTGAAHVLLVAQSRNLWSCSRSRRNSATGCRWRP
jgi:hypothetical protein